MMDSIETITLFRPVGPKELDLIRVEQATSLFCPATCRTVRRAGKEPVGKLPTGTGRLPVPPGTRRFRRGCRSSPLLNCGLWSADCGMKKKDFGVVDSGGGFGGDE
jgi:hypothetical protein